MKVYIQTRNAVFYQLKSVLVQKVGNYMVPFALSFVVCGFFSPPSFGYDAFDKVKFEASETYRSQKVLLSANLFKPDGEGPFPTVVLMHGCGGWQPPVRAALSSYANFLIKNGFAVLNLDSFGPRRNSGGEVCASFKKLKDAREYRTVDAFDAMQYLKTQAFVDANNIFLMGQSNGGSVAINVAKSKPLVAGFRAVVAYYPWCGAFGSRKVNLSSPLLVLGGAKDDWVPPQACKNVVSTGEELLVTVYPEAVHSFDVNILPQKFMGKSVGYNKDAAVDSRAMMLAFFKNHLQSAVKPGFVQQASVKLAQNETQ